MLRRGLATPGSPFFALLRRFEEKSQTCLMAAPLLFFDHQEQRSGDTRCEYNERMASRITESLHKPIALLGWIVFLAKPTWRMIEFLDDIDFVANLFGGSDRVTRGWVSAGVEFLDTGWGTLAMSLVGVGLILMASFRKPGTIYLTKLAEETPLIEDKVYENRDFVGPAIVHFGDGTVLTDSSFFGDPNSVLIEIKQEQFMGAVTFRDCMFKRCRFRNVGIIGKKKLLAEKFRKDSKVIRGK
jgi:hypothetical protein